MSVQASQRCLIVVSLMVLAAPAGLSQEKEGNMPARTRLTWESQRVREIEGERQLLLRAPRDTIPVKDPKSTWQEFMAGRLIARRLSKQDVNDLAASCRMLPVDPTQVPSGLDGLPLLVAVGAPGARPLIRAELAKHGLVELRDYWCVS